jgi:PPOX class probable F420-dependent enzyme
VLVRGQTAAMAFDLHALSTDVLGFLAERHLATLTTMRPDGTAHVAPVGFSFDAVSGLARVITFRSARRVRHVEAGSRATLCQVDGGRWLTLEGDALVTDDPARVGLAVAGYGERYRQPGERDDRVAIEVQVDRMMGRV